MTNNSFSIPDDEFELLESIRKKCEVVIEKPNFTEMVRVGIQILQNLTPQEINNELEKIGRAKRGRKAKPKSTKAKSTTVNDLEIVPFQGISDKQWGLLKTLLRGKQKDREILDGILFSLRYKGKHLVSKPRYATGATRWRVFNKWKEDGTWKRICRIFLESLDEREEQVWSPALLKSLLGDEAEVK